MGTINSFPISTKALSEAPEISALGSEVIAHAGNNGVHVTSQWKSANEQRLANIERALNHIAFDFEEQSGVGATVPFTNPHIVQTRPQILGGKSVAWNQWIARPNTITWSAVGCTVTTTTDTLTITATSSTDFESRYSSTITSVNKGHKVYFATTVSGTHTGDAQISGWENWSGSPGFFIVPHSAFGGRYSNIITISSGYSLTRFSFGKYWRDGATVGATLSFTNTMMIDLTQMFGSGNEPTAVEMDAILTNSYYAYNAGSLVSADVSAVESLKSDNTTLDSLSIPSSLRTDHPLRSAGSVRDEYDFERMVMVQRVGSVDLGSLTWSYDSSDQRFKSDGINAIAKKVTSNSNVANMICATYESKSANNTYLHTFEKSISIDKNGQIAVYDTSAGTDAAAFKTAMSGVYLNYELATYVEHDISSYFVGKPVLSAQSGGSLKFTQSQTPALAVPYEIENTIYLLEYDSWQGGSY